MILLFKKSGNLFIKKKEHSQLILLRNLQTILNIIYKIILIFRKNSYNNLFKLIMKIKLKIKIKIKTKRISKINRYLKRRCLISRVI